MVSNLVCIDFETANGSPSSVCSVGIVIVRDGEVVDSFFSLIHPYPDYYAWFCQQVHGLGPDDTEDAPLFPDVWDQVEDRILAASRRHFGRSLPNHQLHTVAAACGYSLLNHHHALADAEACASIALKIL